MNGYLVAVVAKTLQRKTMRLFETKEECIKYITTELGRMTGPKNFTYYQPKIYKLSSDSNPIEEEIVWFWDYNNKHWKQGSSLQ